MALGETGFDRAWKSGRRSEDEGFEDEVAGRLLRGWTVVHGYGYQLAEFSPRGLEREKMSTPVAFLRDLC